MKKLFKNMSIVLVLALVIGLVPARNASAADYELKVKQKYLYVGAKGEKAHGVDANGNLPANPIKRSYKVKVTGRADGDVLSFKSADRTIAKGSKKYERVFAVAPGETDVAVKVNGTEIGSIHFIVKQNATAVALADLPEGNQFGIGKFEVKTAMTPATATDIVKLHIDDAYKDIAVVNEDGTITTKKPGTFKIYATTQQNNEGLCGVIAKSEEVECTAAVKVVSAVQKSADTVTFTFDNDMTGIAASKDFKVYTKVSGADVVVATKSATVDADEPTKVYVALWTPFTEGTEYFVDYSGQTSSFTAAKLSAQYAASIRFDNLEVVKNTVTEIEFTVLDANGVEMGEDVKTYVTFAGTSTDKIQISSNVILFEEAGLSASVTGTFDAWYDDTTTGTAKENKFSNVALFKSVDTTPVTITSYDWTIGEKPGTLAGLKDVFSADDYEAVQYTAVGDGVCDFMGKVSFSDGSTLYFDAAGEYAVANKNDATKNYAGTVAGNGRVAIATADANIALEKAYKIQGVNAGSTQILITFAGSKTPNIVVPFTVKSAAVPTTMDITADKVKLNSNFVGTDAVTFTVVVKDQYGRLISADIAAEENSRSANAKLTGATVTGANGKYKVVVTSGNVAKVDLGKDFAGVIVLKITASVNGKVVLKNTTKSITVAEGTAEAKSYQLVLDSDALDQILGAARTLDDYDEIATAVSFASFDVNGLQIKPAEEAKAYHEGATGGVFFKVLNGVEDISEGSFVADGSITSVIKNASGAAVKLDAKKLTVKLYNISDDGKTSTCVDVKTITIADSQPSLTVVKKLDKVSKLGAIATEAELATAFDLFYLDNTDLADTADWSDTVFGTNSAYVKSVSYTVTDATYGNYVITVPVGATITY